SISLFPFFFFHAPPTPEIYTLSLHDALPIFHGPVRPNVQVDLPALEAGLTRVLDAVAVQVVELLPADREVVEVPEIDGLVLPAQDRKSTRLNSSHRTISYAVFCLKKKKIYKN